MKMISTVLKASFAFAFLMTGSSAAFAQDTQEPAPIESEEPREVVEGEAPIAEPEPRIVVDGVPPSEEIEPRIVVDGATPADGDAEPENGD